MSWSLLLWSVSHFQKVHASLFTEILKRVPNTSICCAMTRASDTCLVLCHPCFMSRVMSETWFETFAVPWLIPAVPWLIPAVPWLIPAVPWLIPAVPWLIPAAPWLETFTVPWLCDSTFAVLWLDICCAMTRLMTQVSDAQHSTYYVCAVLCHDWTHVSDTRRGHFENLRVIWLIRTRHDSYMYMYMYMYTYMYMYMYVYLRLHVHIDIQQYKKDSWIQQRFLTVLKNMLIYATL